jgi:hypothetical protein
MIIVLNVTRDSVKTLLIKDTLFLTELANPFIHEWAGVSKLNTKLFIWFSKTLSHILRYKEKWFVIGNVFCIVHFLDRLFTMSV